MQPLRSQPTNPIVGKKHRVEAKILNHAVCSVKCVCVDMCGYHGKKQTHIYIIYIGHIKSTLINPTLQLLPRSSWPPPWCHGTPGASSPCEAASLRRPSQSCPARGPGVHTRRPEGPLGSGFRS